jgi:hypothetical protein
MSRCLQCILPAGRAGITLDDQGICNQCRAHEPIRFLGPDALSEVLEGFRGRHPPYDCMVNVSGGRDSSYTLLSLVKDYGMRVLAVNYENPFTDPEAAKNLQKMIRILEVDFVQFGLKRRLHQRILKNNILAWFRHPSPAMVPALCIGCKIIWPHILKIAKRNNIRCIINGGNPFEYTSFKKTLLGLSDTASLKHTYLKNFAGLYREARSNAAYLKPQFLIPTLKGYLFGNPYAPGSALLGRRMQFMDFFHYVPWSEQKVVSRIQDELDWDYPRHPGSTWRFDCRIGHLKDYLYLKTLGMTEKDDFYSKLIREGQTTRDEALSRLTRENVVPLDLVQELFRQLGLDNSKLERWGSQA